MPQRHDITVMSCCLTPVSSSIFMKQQQKVSDAASSAVKSVIILFHLRNFCFAQLQPVIFNLIDWTSRKRKKGGRGRASLLRNNLTWLTGVIREWDDGSEKDWEISQLNKSKSEHLWRAAPISAKMRAGLGRVGSNSCPGEDEAP